MAASLEVRMYLPIDLTKPIATLFHGANGVDIRKGYYPPFGIYKYLFVK